MLAETDTLCLKSVCSGQAVAHVCVALGFTATTSGALDCLTDVVSAELTAAAAAADSCGANSGVGVECKLCGEDKPV